MPYKDPEKAKANKAAYRKKNAVAVKKAIARCYRMNGKQYSLNQKRKNLVQYRLTLEQFQEMIEFQAGLCAICTEPMAPGYGTNVDHCHVTGKVRSLVCNKCNLGIGQLRDSACLVASALTYLEAHNG